MNSGAGLEILDVRIFGLPVAQQRARVRVFKSKLGQPIASMYDPAESRDWKRTVAAQVLPQKPPAPVEGPLVVQLEFFLPRPVSLPKREVFHVKRPDVDNLAKAVKDAIKGIVYRDDSQVVDLNVTKSYSQAPGVRIRILRSLAPRVEQAEIVMSEPERG